MSVNHTCRAAIDASIDAGLLEEPMCLHLDPSSDDIFGPRFARTQSSGNPESTRGQAGLANVAAERAKYAKHNIRKEKDKQNKQNQRDEKKLS